MGQLLIKNAVKVARMKPKVLFLCTGNSCRSQMAEGWAKILKGDKVEAFSAGTNPQGVNPLAVKVMNEVGINITSQSSKHVNTLIDKGFDYVVTVCHAANEACPIFSASAKKLHFGFDDPPRLAENEKTEEEALPHYRRIRDEIKAFIETLPESLETNQN